jgi:hypothetical protein
MTVKRFAAFALIVAISLMVSACGSASDTVSNSPATVERPSVPASPEGNFRADNVAFVAATGKPQLIEFFAFW